MKKTINIALTCLSFIFFIQPAIAQPNQFKEDNPYYSRTDTKTLNVSNEIWKKILSKELYQVAREGATERAFTGSLYRNETKGIYYCAVCGNGLFLSTAKFASACGWPSFYEPLRAKSVLYKKDSSHNMIRTEVVCGRCGSHLGHIFDDGPEPTGKRFCMNSVSLDFEPSVAPQKIGSF